MLIIYTIIYNYNLISTMTSVIKYNILMLKNFFNHVPYITLIIWKNDKEVEVEINGNFEITKILIQINGSIQLNSNVQPVKLATSEPNAGTMVTVTGWGAIKVNESFYHYFILSRKYRKQIKHIFTWKIIYDLSISWEI